VISCVNYVVGITFQHIMISLVQYTQLTDVSSQLSKWWLSLK